MRLAALAASLSRPLWVVLHASRLTTLLVRMSPGLRPALLGGARSLGALVLLMSMLVAFLAGFARSLGVIGEIAAAATLIVVATLLTSHKCLQ